MAVASYKKRTNQCYCFTFFHIQVESGQNRNIFPRRIGEIHMLKAYVAFHLLKFDIYKAE